MSTTGKLASIKRQDPAWSTVVTLDAQYFSRPWTEAQWASIDLSHHKVFVWNEAEKQKGFTLLATIEGDEAAHLLKIFVLPCYQGTKVASEFLSSISELLKSKGFIRIFLEVEVCNLRAIKFYEKSGFKRLRHLKSYYTDGTDALSMELTI